MFFVELVLFYKDQSIEYVGDGVSDVGCLIGQILEQIDGDGVDDVEEEDWGVGLKVQGQC